MPKTTFADVAGADERVKNSSKSEFPQGAREVPGRRRQDPEGCPALRPAQTGKTLLARAALAKQRFRSARFQVGLRRDVSSVSVRVEFGTSSNRQRQMHLRSSSSTKSMLSVVTVVPLGGGHDEREQIAQPDARRDGRLRCHLGVILIAATNRPDILDPGNCCAQVDSTVRLQSSVRICRAAPTSSRFTLAASPLPNPLT